MAIEEEFFSYREAYDQVVEAPNRLLKYGAQLLFLDEPEALKLALSKAAFEKTQKPARTGLLKGSLTTTAVFSLPRNTVELAAAIDSRWEASIGRPEMEPEATISALNDGLELDFLSAEDYAKLMRQTRGVHEATAMVPFFTQERQIRERRESLTDSELIGKGGEFAFLEQISLPSASLTEHVTRMVIANLVTYTWTIAERMREYLNPEGKLLLQGMAPLPLPVGELRIPLRYGKFESELSLNIDAPELLGTMIAVVSSGVKGHESGPESIPESTFSSLTQSLLPQIRAEVARVMNEIPKNDESQSSSIWHERKVEGTKPDDEYRRPFALALVASRATKPTTTDGNFRSRIWQSDTDSYRQPQTTTFYIDSNGQPTIHEATFAHPSFDGKEALLFFNKQKRTFAFLAELRRDTGLLPLEQQATQSEHEKRSLLTHFQLESQEVRDTNEYMEHFMQISQDQERKIRQHYNDFIGKVASMDGLRDKIVDFGIISEMLVPKSYSNYLERNDELRRIFPFPAFLAAALGSLAGLQTEFLDINAYGHVNPALLFEPAIAQKLWKDSTAREDEDIRIAAGRAYSASFLILNQDRSFARNKKFPGTTAMRLAAATGRLKNQMTALARGGVEPSREAAMNDRKIQFSMLESDRPLLFLGALAERYWCTIAAQKISFPYKPGQTEMEFAYNLAIKVRKNDEATIAAVKDISGASVVTRMTEIMQLVQDFLVQSVVGE